MKFVAGSDIFYIFRIRRASSGSSSVFFFNLVCDCCNQRFRARVCMCAVWESRFGPFRGGFDLMLEARVINDLVANVASGIWWTSFYVIANRPRSELVVNPFRTSCA